MKSLRPCVLRIRLCYVPVPHSVCWVAAMELARVEIVRFTPKHRLTSASLYNQDQTWTPRLLFPPPMCWDARRAPAHPAKQIAFHICGFPSICVFQRVHDPDLAQVCPRYHMGYTYMFKMCIYLEVGFIRCSVFYLSHLAIWFFRSIRFLQFQWTDSLT